MPSIARHQVFGHKLDAQITVTITLTITVPITYLISIIAIATIVTSQSKRPHLPKLVDGLVRFRKSTGEWPPQ